MLAALTSFSLRARSSTTGVGSSSVGVFYLLGSATCRKANDMAGLPAHAAILPCGLAFEESPLLRRQGDRDLFKIFRHGLSSAFMFQHGETSARYNAPQKQVCKFFSSMISVQLIDLERGDARHTSRAGFSSTW